MNFSERWTPPPPIGGKKYARKRTRLISAPLSPPASSSSKHRAPPVELAHRGVDKNRRVASVVCTFSIPAYDLLVERHPVRQSPAEEARWRWRLRSRPGLRGGR